MSPGSLSPSSVSARAGSAPGSPRFSRASPRLFSSETLSGCRGGGVRSHPHFTEGDTEAQRGEGAQPPMAPSDLGAPTVPAGPAGTPFPRLRGCSRWDRVKRKHFGFPAGSGVPGSRWGAGETGAPLAFHLEPEVPPRRPPWGPPQSPTWSHQRAASEAHLLPGRYARTQDREGSSPRPEKEALPTSSCTLPNF